jgi:hypothetical protein
VCGIVVTREVYGTMTHYYTTPYHWHDGRVYYCVPDEQAEAYERSIAAWMRQQAEAHRRAQEYLKDWPP